MYIDQFRLDGKIALITGGSRGIGKQIAMGFAEQGASVVITARKQEPLDATAEEIRQKGAVCLPVACHVGKPDQIRDLFEKVKAEHGGINILVNNAATNPFFGPILDISDTLLDKTIEVNLKGAFLMSQAAARMMVERGGGSIINIASVAAFSPSLGQGVYSITKAGVVSMTKAFAKELVTSRIRVNAICPSLTETKFSQMLIETKEIYDIAVKMIPMGRHAQPSEIVGAALYLASDASSFVTGSCLTLDGGQTA